MKYMLLNKTYTTLFII